MRNLFLLLALIVAGVQSSWAQAFVKTYQYNNFTFDLYSDALYFSVAVLKEINGQETDVTVPAYIENEGRTYYVRCGEGTITNNYVKTLIFNGSYDFNYHMGTSSSNVYMSSGLSCSQLTNITFNTVTFYYGGISYLLNLNCPLLTDISFIGNVPTFPEFESYGISFPPYWSKICSARGENVTAHVKNWTQAECDQNHQNAYVWKDFAAVVPYSETPQTVNVNASVSDGGALQISGQSALTNGSQTYEVEKGSDLTFYAYPSSTNCQVAHVYVNGTDVIGQITTQSDGKLKYTITNLQENVTISVVGASYTNQTFVRLGGNGTASFTTKHEGQTKSYNIPANGVVTAPLYEFDSGGFIRFVVTTSGEETVEIFRNGINVTSIFEKSGTTYTFETDDWEANDLWFAFVENVLDEAIWTIKYTDQRQFITFKDAAVKTICLANWDTNGDGKLTMAEAAAVTSLNANGSSSSVFYNNTEITSFTELQYFTGLTSLKSAFYGCSALEEVVVPNGVTNLNSAFGECLALKTVVVPETVTNIERAFGLVINSENISSLEHVILPSGLETIGQYAFVKSGLKSIDIPENVTTIGTYAFHSCVNLKTLYIPSSVTSIKGFIPDMGNSLSFHNCTGLESIAVDAQNNNYKSPNGCNAIIEKSSNKLILGCRNTVIPDGVVRLGGYSFYKQPITSVVIPESVTAIEASCFYNCADLAMVECKSETPPSIASTSFSGISADAVLKVPSGCTEAYKAAGWKTQDEDGVFKQIVEAEKSVTWNITQGGGMAGTQVIITRNGEEEESTLSSAFTAVKINNVGVEKVTLKVPVGHVEQVTKYRVRLLSYDENQDAALRNYLRQKFNMSSTRIALLLQTLGYIPTYFDTEEEALVIVGELATFNATSNIVSSLINQAVSDNVPIKVIYNGVDITSQMTFGDPLYAIYEVPIANLLNSAWEVSFDTSHRQTFVRSGGMLTTDIQYAIYNHELTVEIPNGIVTTVDLPPYSDTSENLQLNIRVADGESFKVLRNGIDVTYVFDYDEEEGYRNYFHNGGNISDEMSIQNWGFNTRDAAVWEIVYKSVEEQMKTLRVSNTDQMEIVYERNYTDGTTIPEYFKNPETGEIAEYRELFFDDSDRENTSSIYLKVPIPESQPIRVLCNGEDVTYSKHDEWINENWVTYIASMTQDQTWDISYDTSHKQTFIVKGGLYPEVNYEYKTGDIFKGVQVGGITEVCLPDYNPDYDNTYADFTIGTLPNESFTALRNGVDVTDKFTKEVVSDNLWRYTFNFDNSDVAAALGVDLRDPAVWQITIGDTASYDLNNDNKVDISDVTKLVNKVLNR